MPAKNRPPGGYPPHPGISLGVYPTLSPLPVPMRLRTHRTEAGYVFGQGGGTWAQGVKKNPPEKFWRTCRGRPRQSFCAGSSWPYLPDSARATCPPPSNFSYALPLRGLDLPRCAAPLLRLRAMPPLLRHGFWGVMGALPSAEPGYACPAQMGQHLPER